MCVVLGRLSRDGASGQQDVVSIRDEVAEVGGAEEEEDASPARRSAPERIVHVVILTVAFRTATEAYGPLGLVVDGRLTASGRLIWPLVAAVSAVLLLRVPPAQRRLAPTALMVLVGAVAASTLWSSDRPRTAYQAIVLIAILLAGSALASRHTPNSALLLVARYLAVAVVVNAACAITGLSDPLSSGALMEHKNLLGLMAGAASLTAVCARRLLDGWRAVVMTSSAVVGVVVTFASDARTSLFSAAAAGFVLIVMRLRQRRHQGLAVAVGSASLAAALLFVRRVGGIDGVLRASGKDATLTGRTEIWTAVLEVAHQHPILGRGFFSLWGDATIARLDISVFDRFTVRSSHNGYLEMYLGVGIVGLAVLLLALVAVGRQSLERARSGSVAGLWAVAICVLAAVHNLDESVVPGSVQTMMFMLLVIATACPPRRSRAAAGARAV